MDTYNVNSLKFTKANAVKKPRQLQNLSSLFRLIEFVIFLVFISRFSTHLPGAVKNLSEYFRDISRVLFGPRTVFVIGNVIILILFAKSGQFSGQGSAKKKSGYDLYDEFVEKSQSTQVSNIKYPSKGISKTEKSCNSGEIKKIQMSQNVRASDIKRPSKDSLCQGSLITQGTHGSRETRNYRRSQSENSSRSSMDNRDRSQLVLRRSQTEKGMKNVDCTRRSVNQPYPEDKMSDEEFRSVVEAFIARQQKLRNKEECFM